MTAKRKTTKQETKKSSAVKAKPAEELAKVLREVKVQPDDLLTKLKQHNISSLVAIIGSEHLRIRRLVQWIRDEFFDPNQSSAIQVYFGGEISSSKQLDSIASSLKTRSLFAQNQLVVIFDADAIKAGPAAELAKMLEESEGTCLVLLTAPSIPKRSVLFSIVETIGSVFAVEALSGNKLKRWIEREVVQLGASGVTEQAVELLVASFGTDIMRLQQELSKLALLVTRGGVIGHELVEQLSYRSPERTTFQLVQCIAKKDLVQSFALLKNLLEQGTHPLQLSAFLGKLFRTMLATRDSRSTELHPEIGNTWFIRNLGGADRLFGTKELTFALDHLTKLDLSLKDSGLPDELVLEQTVQRLVERKPLSL